MWIMTNYGILMPAVLPEQYRVRKNPEWDMQVRGRDRDALLKARRRLIEMRLTASKVRDTHEMDYEWRFYTSRHSFASLMALEITEIDYVKFKPATERPGGGGHALHNLYDTLWFHIARFYGSIPTPVLKRQSDIVYDRRPAARYFLDEDEVS